MRRLLDARRDGDDGRLDPLAGQIMLPQLFGEFDKIARRGDVVLVGRCSGQAVRVEIFRVLHVQGLRLGVGLLREAFRRAAADEFARAGRAVVAADDDHDAQQFAEFDFLSGDEAGLRGRFGRGGFTDGNHRVQRDFGIRLKFLQTKQQRHHFRDGRDRHGFVFILPPKLLLLFHVIDKHAVVGLDAFERRLFHDWGGAFLDVVAMDENLQPLRIRDGDFAPVAFTPEDFHDKMFLEHAYGGRLVGGFRPECRVHEHSAAFQMFGDDIPFDDGFRVDLIPLAGGGDDGHGGSGRQNADDGMFDAWPEAHVEIGRDGAFLCDENGAERYHENEQ